MSEKKRKKELARARSGHQTRFDFGDPSPDSVKDEGHEERTVRVAAGRKTVGKIPTSALELSDLLRPTKYKLVVRKPREVGRGRARRLHSGLFAPAESHRVRGDYGFVAEVIAVGPDCEEHFGEPVSPGDLVLLAQFAGIPVYTDIGETNSWLVATGDILALVDRRYHEYIDSITVDDDQDNENDAQARTETQPRVSPIVLPPEAGRVSPAR